MSQAKGYPEKQICLIVTCFFIASLIPLIWIAFYNHPCVDDYSYGDSAYAAWRSTGSFWEAVTAAGKRTAQAYREWQGTFSAVFVMALQPGTFGVIWYQIGSVVILGTFITASLYF